MRSTLINELPAPFPGELLYSVISRYHKHSANIRQVTTYRELFGEERTMDINPFIMSEAYYSNGKAIIRGKSVEEMMKYTLDPYVLRYTSPWRKREIIEKLNQGENVPNRPSVTRKKNTTDTVLRYCPLCCKADEEKYGEMYWHASHQIPIMPVCVKHSCRVMDSTVTRKYASFHFSSASRISCPILEPDFNVTNEEMRFSRYLELALAAPFSQNTTSSTNAIEDKLIEEEYVIYKKNSVEYHGSELYKSLTAYFGKELTSEVFSEKNMSVIIRRMISTHSITDTSKYMMLAAFFEISPDTVFEDREPSKKVQSDLQMRLIKMHDSHEFWSRTTIAQQLGILPREVDALAASAGLAPFWRTTQKGKHALPQVIARVYLRADQKERIAKRASELNMSSVSSYIKWCIEKDISLD